MIRDSAVVHLHADDNVAFATRSIDRDELISAANGTIQSAENIRMGHQVAPLNIDQRRPIIKYGQTRGFAETDIAAGAWGHSHNVGLTEFAREHAPATAIPPAPEPLKGHTFQGDRRADGLFR